MRKMLSNKVFLTVSLILAALYAAIAIGQLKAAEETFCIPLGTITLEPPSSVETRRSPVEFPHSVHFSMACQTCHHKWNGESPVVSCQTSGCHDLAELPPQGSPATETARYYKNAFHKQCIGCHKEISAKNKAIAMTAGPAPSKLPASGPTGCIECHPE